MHTRPNSNKVSRTLWLIVGALAAAVIAAAIPLGIRAHRQHLALKTFDPAEFDVETRELAPDWIVRVASHLVDDPRDWFSEITAIRDWSGKPVDSHLKVLAGISTLEELCLNGGDVTDAGLKYLSGLSHLRHLDLRSIPLTEASLEQIGKLSSLEVLDIGYSGISEETLTHLTGLKQLQRLGLNSARITEAGLQVLQRFPNLKSIELGDTPVFKEVSASITRGDSNWLEAALIRTPALTLAVDSTGDTLLHLAVEQEKFNPGVVRTLLAAGLNLEAKSEFGPTVLECAAKLHRVSPEERESRLKFLLACGAEYTMPVAIVRDDLDRVRTLVSSPDPSIDRWELLLVAIDYGRASIVGELIDTWKLDPDQSDQGIPIVCRATENPDVLRELLNRGADPNARMAPCFFSGYNSRVYVKDSTALHDAASKGCALSAELLIERGAAVDAQDNRGRTPLMQAVEHGRIAVLQLLVRHGADPTIRDANSETAVTLAEKQASRFPLFWKSLIELLRSRGEGELVEAK